MYSFTALLAGLVFGFGLIVSGMANPAKVVGFLDLFGRWDPSLALVMGGAIGVGVVAFALARRRTRSLLGAEMRLPSSDRIDRRLIGGAAAVRRRLGRGGLLPGARPGGPRHGRAEGTRLRRFHARRHDDLRAPRKARHARRTRSNLLRPGSVWPDTPGRRLMHQPGMPSHLDRSRPRPDEADRRSACWPGRRWSMWWPRCCTTAARSSATSPRSRKRRWSARSPTGSRSSRCFAIRSGLPIPHTAIIPEQQGPDRREPRDLHLRQLPQHRAGAGEAERSSMPPARLARLARRAAPRRAAWRRTSSPRCATASACSTTNACARSSARRWSPASSRSTSRAWPASCSTC